MDRDEMLRVLRAFEREGLEYVLIGAAIQRFRTIEDMAAATVVVRPGGGFERFARHCARYWVIAPRAYPRGVFKFRSIAEARAARERVTDESALRRRDPSAQ